MNRIYYLILKCLQSLCSMKLLGMHARDTDKFLVFIHEDVQGPWSRQDILKMIKDGELSWLNFAINSDGNCIRIFEISGMETEIPKRPHHNVVADAIRKSISSESGETERPASQPNPSPPMTPAKNKMSGWYLQVEGSKFGPLTLKELGLLLNSGKLHGKIFGWRNGLKKWLPVDCIDEIQNFIHSKAAGANHSATIKRKSIRVPLMATVRFSFYNSDGESAIHFTGICRDISIEGILIVSEGFMIQEGDAIRIEVYPTDTNTIPAFHATADVVRTVKEEHGFAVLFRDLPKEVRDAIKKHAISFLEEQA